MTSYRIGAFNFYIGKIKATPKGWQRLLVPIKGYHYDDYELPQIMHLKDELYFIVKKEYQTYNVPFKKEFFRFTWDEFVNMVETTEWSKRTRNFGGKNHTDWSTQRLKSIERDLVYYDAHEELKEKLSDQQIEILVQRIESEKSLAEKLVDRMLGY
ncbi:MAG: hypothetical protein IKJ97_08955 [Bacteroidaceae bacterium]|nr:hypothetical protein [Bacteroidaceae bacterium]